jgi:hypothetical protein
MKKTQINNTRRRENPITRKNITKGKINFAQKKKIAAHQNPMTVMMMKSFF